MLLSERTLKWAMRFYPSLFFQRIWVMKFEPGFRGVHVKINKSILNINYNKSIFGGTIFSAADPFYPVLFHQLLISKGYNIIAWSKSSQIHYLKPALTDLYFNIHISDENIAHCEEELNMIGKHLKVYPIDMYDKNGQLCASVLNELYVRNLNFQETNLPMTND
jgi:acyl-coenzyme A thioesterase PaaI-like protein